MRLKSILTLTALIAMCTVASAQIDQSVILPENATKRVSDHVYAIMGFPNIAIVDQRVLYGPAAHPST